MQTAQMTARANATAVNTEIRRIGFGMRLVVVGWSC
jgi:hypothetical protein